MPDKAAAIFLKTGVLTPQGLAAAQALKQRDGGTLSEAILRLGLLDEEHLVSAFQKNLMIPRVSAAALARVARDVLQAVPPHMAAELRVIPTDIDSSGNLTLAMVDPSDDHAADEVAAYTQRQVQRAVASPTAMREALRTHYGVFLNKPGSAKAGVSSPANAPVAATPAAPAAPAPAAAPTPAATPAPAAAAPNPSPVPSKPAAAAQVATKPAAAQVATKPAAAQVATKPAAAQVATKPAAAQVATKPAAAQVATKPAAAQVATKPAAAQVATKPAAAQVATKPAAAQVATKPAATAPAATAPAATAPAATAPAATKPAVTAAAPVATKPVAAAPVATKPVAAAPVATKPVAATPAVASKPVTSTPSTAPAAAAKPATATPFKPAVATPAQKPATSPRSLEALARALNPDGTPVVAAKAPAPAGDVGPFGSFIEKMRAASERDQVVSLLLDAMSGLADVVGLFVLQQKALACLDGRGADHMVMSMKWFTVAAEEDSIFNDVMTSREPHIGTVPESKRAALAALGSSDGKLALVPLVVGQKSIGVLYADELKKDLQPLTSSLKTLTQEAGSAFTRIILQRKKQG
ncbi:MAG: hypothetical protein U1A78_01315 [Polyangia bacterium]